MEHTILFKTICGSRLYGLAHKDSDWDYYTVVDKVNNRKAKYATHAIVDGVDSVVVDFGTWLNLCRKGTPQALEAMFSTKAEVDHIEDFRRAFRAGNEAVGTYGHTIKAMKHDDFKHKRHMIRLALNLRDLRTYGRFNPALAKDEIELCNELAKLPMEAVYNDALAIGMG